VDVAITNASVIGSLGNAAAPECGLRLGIHERCLESLLKADALLQAQVSPGEAN